MSERDQDRRWLDPSSGVSSGLRGLLESAENDAGGREQLDRVRGRLSVVLGAAFGAEGLSLPAELGQAPPGGPAPSPPAAPPPGATTAAGKAAAGKAAAGKAAIGKAAIGKAAIGKVAIGNGLAFKPLLVGLSIGVLGGGAVTWQVSSAIYAPAAAPMAPTQAPATPAVAARGRGKGGPRERDEGPAERDDGPAERVERAALPASADAPSPPPGVGERPVEVAPPAPPEGERAASTAPILAPPRAGDPVAAPAPREGAVATGPAQAPPRASVASARELPPAPLAVLFSEAHTPPTAAPPRQAAAVALDETEPYGPPLARVGEGPSVPRSGAGRATGPLDLLPGAPGSPFRPFAVPAGGPAPPQAAPGGPPSPGTAAPAAPASAATPAGIADEARLLRTAQEALVRSPGRALELLEEHRRRFPSGVLAQEREVFTIEALWRGGRREAAVERANRFLSAHAGSSHAARVRSLIGQGK